MASSFKIVSANIGTSMLSIADMLKIDKPDILFLQEVTCPTPELVTRVAGLGYSGECNVDILHPTRPGTAIIWRQTLNVSEVNCLIDRRAQSIRCGGESLSIFTHLRGLITRRKGGSFILNCSPISFRLGARNFL